MKADRKKTIVVPFVSFRYLEQVGGKIQNNNIPYIARSKIVSLLPSYSPLLFIATPFCPTQKVVTCEFVRQVLLFFSYKFCETFCWISLSYQMIMLIVIVVLFTRQLGKKFYISMKAFFSCFIHHRCVLLILSLFKRCLCKRDLYFFFFFAAKSLFFARSSSLHTIVHSLR